MSNLALNQKRDILEISAELKAQVLIAKNTRNLTAEAKLNFLAMLCHSLGLNPLTNPFEFISFDGKEFPYAKKDATDQLRAIYDVSVHKIEIREDNGLYMVTAHVSMPNGRTDSSMGVLVTKGLSGLALANAMMKCETKAKRRATLSICGLGFLDETEVEDMTPSNVEPKNAPAALIETKDEELQSKIAEICEKFRKKFGISKKQIAAKCGVPSVEDLDEMHIAGLNELGRDLVNERLKPEDAFPRT